MIRDILLWALDMRGDCSVEPANLVVVSNNISPDPEFVAVLQAVAKKKNFSVLLVQSGKNMYVKKVDIPTESFDWLWESITGGGNPMEDVEFASTKTEAAAEENKDVLKTATEEDVAKYTIEDVPRWIAKEEAALAILETEEEAVAKLTIDIETEEEALAEQETKEEKARKKERNM